MSAHYNFYETLNLDRRLTSPQLIEAIDARLTELHQQNVPQGDDRVQELFAARAVLGIEHNRAQYDAVLSREDAPTLTIPDLQMLAGTGALPPQHMPFTVTNVPANAPAETPAPTPGPANAEATESSSKDAVSEQTRTDTTSSEYTSQISTDESSTDDARNASSQVDELGSNVSETVPSRDKSQLPADPFLGISRENAQNAMPSHWPHTNDPSSANRGPQPQLPNQSQEQPQPRYAQNPHQPTSTSENAASAFLATLPASVKAIGALIVALVAIEIFRGTVNAFVVLTNSDFYYPNSFPILIPAIGALVIAANLGHHRKFGVLVNGGFAISVLLYALTYMTVVPRDSVLTVLIGFVEFLIAIGIAVCTALPESRKYFASEKEPSHHDGEKPSTTERK